MAYKLFIAILEEVVYPTSPDPIGQFCVDLITGIGLIMVIIFTLQAIL